MKIKNITVAFLLLLGTWFLLNGKYDLVTLGVGVIVSLFISLIMCIKCEIFSEMNFSPKGILYFFAYIFVFLGELVKSNLDIARRVLTPSLPINPGIVEVETKLKSKLGRMILANSITLTPGTLSVKVENDTYFIHCVNVEHTDIEGATKDIIKKFEKYLEVIYG
ncbi:MAG: Na+/H+ antiporter subunit E [Bacteroidota bacterium]|nr:Na+/H+ antiporter subunit E [Bacteroidota bacterium]